MKRFLLAFFLAASAWAQISSFPPSAGGGGSGASPAGSAVTDHQCWASATTLGVCTDYSGTGNIAKVTSPTFITPTLGVASATTINKVTITAPATGSTLTIPDGVTLNAGAGGTLGSNAFTSTAYAPLASPTFTGVVTIPTPFTLGATSVTSTGTQLNYLSAATGTTGTTSTSIVFSTSPALVTPILGAATFTSLTQTVSSSSGQAPINIANTGLGGNAVFITGGSQAGYFGIQSSSNGTPWTNGIARSAYVATPNAFPIQMCPHAICTAIFQDGGEIDIGTTTPRGGSQLLAVAGGTGTNGDIIAGIRFTCTGDGCSPVAGGATAGTFTVTTTGAAAPVVTMGSSFTAPAGFACFAQNQTTGNLIRQTASSTTTATFGGTTVSGDTISFVCHGY